MYGLGVGAYGGGWRFEGIVMHEGATLLGGLCMYVSIVQ